MDSPLAASRKLLKVVGANDFVHAGVPDLSANPNRKVRKSLELEFISHLSDAVAQSVNSIALLLTVC